MCGIAGFWSSQSSLIGAKADEILRRMASSIAHRGPDGEGFWKDDEAGIGFAHRRLAVLDLSLAGAQPMRSASGRYTLIYNGEIYNHQHMRSDLENAGAKVGWRGTSDTETLLAAIEHWGVQDALNHCFGMFAFALWDARERTLLLARDRLGEKPLYYGWIDGVLVFASELKAFQAFADRSLEIDQAALGAYLRFSYVPSPHSIYRGIHKLPAGHLLRLKTSRDLPEPHPYWSLQAIAEAAPRPSAEARPESLAALEQILEEVVASQMISDVPLGVFLSGGIDSSLVAALMQKAAPGQVKSFSIGFDDPRFDRSTHAQEVASYLGSEHQSFTVTEKDALALIPDLPHIYDEPFADSSQLPTTLLSRLTQQKVTVALSGDGGDEIFGGYNRYLYGPKLWNSLGRLPRPARRLITAGTRLGQQLALRTGSAAFTEITTSSGLPVTTLDRLSKFGDALGRARDFDSFYREIVSTWSDPLAVLRKTQEAQGLLDTSGALMDINDETELMMALDALTYLPDDILVKVDRAAMSCSLETRAPFLDARVVEAAWKLPLSAKVKERQGKTVLREILYRHVPKKLVERPKRGFAIPLDDWLRGGLKDWAEDLLSSDRLKDGGFFEANVVRQVWSDHLRGRDNAGPRLWTVLMFQSWRGCYA